MLWIIDRENEKDIGGGGDDKIKENKVSLTIYLIVRHA